MNETTLKTLDPMMDEAQSNGAESSTAMPSGAAPQVGLRRLRAEAEIHAISQALQQTRWNRKRAAELLSISYRGLLYKIRQHNITSSTATQIAGMPETGKE